LNRSKCRTDSKNVVFCCCRFYFKLAKIGYDLKIKPCIGCLKYRPNKKCVLPYDDAHLLSEKIKQADILIIGSPTYWGNIPGPLTTLFDKKVTTFEYVEAKSMKKKTNTTV